MTSQSLRDLIFHSRGNKEGLMTAKMYLQCLPMHEVVSKIQEAIDSHEDNEIRMSVELQKTSEPPSALL